MRSVRFASIALLVSVLGCLVGCGGGAPAGDTAAPVQPANLAGNWLLLGPLPSGVTPVPAPSVAMSFDVNGGQITGAGHMELPCTSGSGSLSVGYGAALSGTVASDGSFTIVSPEVTATSMLPSISMSGTIPKSVGGSWQGTYTVSGGAALCPIAGTGSFTATPIADVTGTYTGSGTVYSFPTGSVTGVPSALSISMTLQQGGPLYGLGKTSASYSRLALNGSIVVSGNSCFSKGASSPDVQSLMLGSEFVAGFAMDDGSSLTVVGDVSTGDASQLSLIGWTVEGGNCSGSSTPDLNPIVLSR